jgi:hypothetical protein
VDVDVTPAVADTEHRALLVALERADVGSSGAQPPYESRWRLAGLREAVDCADADDDYAFSPRRTRGATRA